MKAPEIIFLPIVNIGVEDGECPAPIWWNKDKSAKHSEVVKAIEYIRKDLLLEWAKEEQAKCSSETHPYAMFMNVVIDKLNSM